MALLPIVKYPNEILRRKTQPVKAITDETQILIDNMIETLRDAPGVGLAAPQVNVPLRIAVIEYGEGEEFDDEDAPPAPKKLYTLINPEITRMSTETLMGSEGCLSMPGLIADVERAESVTVTALNRRGQPVKIKASGWLARIFQHEIDHLDGVLFTEKAKEVRNLEDEEHAE
jgi:peptide deformylase